MRKVLFGLAIVGMMVGASNAAILSLEADGGGSSLDLAPGQSGNMSIRLFLHDIDSGFAFVNAFLDDDDNSSNGEVNVTGLVQGFEGPNIVYDRSAFWDVDKDPFPSDLDISHDLSGNEYGLVMADPIDGGWGVGTYIIDTLELTHNGSSTSGTVPVTFEEGARQPAIFTSDFSGLVWGTGFAGVIPDFVDPGVGGYGDGPDGDGYNPFNINFVPEPASLALVAFGGLALLRRRR